MSLCSLALIAFAGPVAVRLAGGLLPVGLGCPTDAVSVSSSGYGIVTPALLAVSTSSARYRDGRHTFERRSLLLAVAGWGTPAGACMCRLYSSQRGNS